MTKFHLTNIFKLQQDFTIKSLYHFSCDNNLVGLINYIHDHDLDNNLNKQLKQLSKKHRLYIEKAIKKIFMQCVSILKTKDINTFFVWACAKTSIQEGGEK